MPNEIESYNKKLYFHTFKTKETKKRAKLCSCVKANCI